jgi:hypothetical protein
MKSISQTIRNFEVESVNFNKKRKYESLDNNESLNYITMILKNTKTEHYQDSMTNSLENSLKLKSVLNHQLFSKELLDNKSFNNSNESSSLDENLFPDWSLGDYDCFINAVLRHGKSNKDLILNDVNIETGKSLSYISKYYEKFWKVIHCIDDYETLTSRIDENEDKLIKISKDKEFLYDKLNEFSDGLKFFNINYGAMKGKMFNDEEDFFLLLMLDKHGYGSWDKIQLEISNSWLFRFDWFFKSRNIIELQKRCEHLIRLVSK